MGERDYGVADPAVLAGMSGIEALRAMIAGRLPAPTMGRTLGFRLIEVEEGRALFEGDPGAEHLNPMGGVHGGWALAMIDSAAGCALHTTLAAGVGYATVETKANFTRPIRAGGGTLRCEGRVVARGRQVGTAEAYLRDAEGRVVAHGTSTLMIFGG